MSDFDRRKAKALAEIDAHVDKSPKGSIDAPIRDLITYMNALPDLYTTSSCSGRIAIFSDRPLHQQQADFPVDDTTTDSAKPSSDNAKGVGTWLYVNHDHDTPLDWRSFLHEHPPCSECTGDLNSMHLISFKFEPFILHAEARNVDTASTLYQLAMASGYRNSGMGFAKKSGRWMVAVRSAQQVNAPVGHVCEHGRPIWFACPLQWDSLSRFGADKMHHNFDRVRQFELALKSSSLVKEE